jgi:hypothetical protein
MSKILGITLSFAFVGLVLTTIFALVTKSSAPQLLGTVEIAVEHPSPLTLTVELTRQQGKEIITLGHDAKEGIHLSVPEGWQRGEVRGAALSAFTAEPPTLGFRRWVVPASAAVTFHSDQAFEHMTIHNPSGVPVKIRYTGVDLDKQTADHEVYLLQQGEITIP